jgi:hypothetical protein
MKPFSCLLLLVLCLVPACVLSQSTSATISGGVTDPTGNFIPDASVEVVNDETGVRYSVQTNSSGMYFVPILPPGHYRVQVSRQAFKTIIKSDVVLNVQGALALNFVLPAGGSKEGAAVRPCAAATVDFPSQITRCIISTRALGSATEDYKPLRLEKATFGSTDDDVILSFGYQSLTRSRSVGQGRANLRAAQRAKRLDGRWSGGYCATSAEDCVCGSDPLS